MPMYAAVLIFGLIAAGFELGKIPPKDPQFLCYDERDPNGTVFQVDQEEFLSMKMRAEGKDGHE